MADRQKEGQRERGREKKKKKAVVGVRAVVSNL